MHERWEIGAVSSRDDGFLVPRDTTAIHACGGR
jgi:hypothetical protein